MIFVITRSQSYYPANVTGVTYTPRTLPLKRTCCCTDFANFRLPANHLLEFPDKLTSKKLSINPFQRFFLVLW